MREAVSDTSDNKKWVPFRRPLGQPRQPVVDHGTGDDGSATTSDIGMLSSMDWFAGEILLV